MSKEEEDDDDDDDEERDERIPIYQSTTTSIYRVIPIIRQTRLKIYSLLVNKKNAILIDVYHCICCSS